LQDSPQRIAMGEAGLQLIENSQGATKRIMQLIKQYLIK